MSMYFYFFLLIQLVSVSSLATPGGSGSSESKPLPNLFDRFSVVCPCDASCVGNYDASLEAAAAAPENMENMNVEYEQAIWAAVYRSNNNQPSVLMRDELFQSMRLAIDAPATSTPPPAAADSDSLIETPMAQLKPVAIACLRPSEHFESSWVLDCMRCALKKENTDPDCDGGSEHTEAISAAVDSLLLHYLTSYSSKTKKKTTARFEAVIRTKGTLVSGVLLEERGFVPVDSLQKDMATHISSLDSSLEMYARRAVEAKAGARERALSIVSHLGQVDREADLKAAAKLEKENGMDDDDSDYDPWANVNIC